MVQPASYLPDNGAGGYFDAKAAAKWTFPTWKQIDESWAKKSTAIYDGMPQTVKDMATIGCETCHGPAAQHVKDGAKVMDASWANGACDQCHGTRGGHTRGVQLSFSKHSQDGAQAWTYPTGASHQDCVKCHSATGFVSFLKSPTNKAAWDNNAQSLSCAGCHDPHSEANAFQLRVVSKPVELPFTLTKDVGLSATCYTCHHNGTSAEAFASGKATGLPHYPSDAEMMSDTGGITYGQTVPNTPHGAMVGANAMPNPAYDPKNSESPKFLYTPVGADKGNVPGSCVVCHMAPAVTAANDPLQFKVGGTRSTQ